MASINKVIIIGNLGQDPEIRYTANGTAVCSLSVATTRSWKDKQSGEKQEETEWHRVVFYDRLAEVAGEYLAKGRPVYVEGRLKTRKWQDKDGIDRYTTEIIGESMQLLGSRDGGDGGQGGGRQQGRQAPRGDGYGHGDHGGRQQPRQGYGQQQPQQRQQPRQQPSRAPTGFDDMDDDIPF